MHKTFEERLEEYGGKIDVCDFDWGEPVGRECTLITDSLSGLLKKDIDIDQAKDERLRAKYGIID